MKLIIKKLINVTLAIVLISASTSCKKDNNAQTENVERIALLVDYEVGYGGYTYSVYNPYVFFKNNIVVKEPLVPVDEIDTNNLTKGVAVGWGAWKQSGNKVIITWGNGSTSQKDWPGYNSIAADKNEKLQGGFGSISGGGDLAIGGSVGTLSYSQMSFTSDGWFTNKKISGGGNAEVSAYSNKTTAGRYVIDGYTITLTFNNGDSKRLFFCFYGNDKKVFRIAGRTYTED